MKIENQIKLFLGVLIAVVISLGVIDNKKSLMTMEEYADNCHVTETC